MRTFTLRVRLSGPEQRALRRAARLARRNLSEHTRTVLLLDAAIETGRRPPREPAAAEVEVTR